MEILDLVPHLSSPIVFTDHESQTRVALGDDVLNLAIACWGPTPADSLARLAARGAQVFFCVGEFSARTREIASAVAGAGRCVWLGEARQHYRELAGLGLAAAELGATAATRRWPGSRLTCGQPTLTVEHGSGLTAARLDLHATDESSVAIRACLGRHTLFSIEATLEESPAVAVRAVAALAAGERLSESEAMLAQRETQRAYLTHWALAYASGCAREAHGSTGVVDDLLALLSAARETGASPAGGTP